MKTSAPLLLLLLVFAFASTPSQSEAVIPWRVGESCDLYGADRLICVEYDDNDFPFEPKYGHIRHLSFTRGTFTRLNVDARYGNLTVLTFHFVATLRRLRFADYASDFRYLREIVIKNNNVPTQLDTQPPFPTTLNTLRVIGARIDAFENSSSLASFSGLRRLFLHQVNLATLDLWYFPGGLRYLSLSNNDDVAVDFTAAPRFTSGLVVAMNWNDVRCDCAFYGQVVTALSSQQVTFEDTQTFSAPAQSSLFKCALGSPLALLSWSNDLKALKEHNRMRHNCVF